MTNLKLALVCGALLAAISVSNRELSVAPAQPFWELQGVGPSARETDDIAAIRTAARDAAVPDVVGAAR